VPVSVGNHDEEAGTIGVKYGDDVCRETIKVGHVLHDWLGVSKSNGSVRLEYDRKTNPVGSPGIADMLLLQIGYDGIINRRSMGAIGRLKGMPRVG